MNERGFLGGGALYAVAAVAWGASLIVAVLYGMKLEAENWMPVIAAQDAEIATFKRESDMRAKAAAESGKRHAAELARVKKQAEADRDRWVQEATDGWGHYLDSERVRSAEAGDGTDLQVSLAAARADAARARAGLERVIAGAGEARLACEQTAAQLKALQAWVSEQK